LIELDDVVVVVGEYYYNNSKRKIEKRSTKRKIGEDPPSKGSSNKVISWKLGPNPQVNALDNSSSLSAFVGENSVLCVN
jgi:hypothetical protein